MSFGEDSENPVDRRIGQTLVSPPAKPGDYLINLLTKSNIMIKHIRNRCVYHKFQLIIYSPRYPLLTDKLPARYSEEGVYAVYLKNFFAYQVFI